MANSVTGRNELCPCGSGKKYKRCCGVNAAPKLYEPKAAKAGTPPPGVSPELLEQMDPQVLADMMRSFQQLPKGQLQRLQALMQKAMRGKDIAAEARELENQLPPHFQALMKTWMESAAASGSAAPVEEAKTSSSDLTEEEARRIVAEAAKSGAIDAEKAHELLEAENGAAKPSAEADQNEKTSKIGKLWKSIAKKKD